MEVLNDRVSALTNYEVLQLLNESKKEEAAKPKYDRVSQLGRVTSQTLKYLKESPAATQTAEKIASCIKAVAPFNLTAGETLQVINLRPATTTDVQLIVEEVEERFKTEDHLNSLLEAITDSLPPKPTRSSS